MQITHQADYALRAILFLAKMPQDQRVSTSRIAEENKIPPSFLTKIISQLSIAGLIHTSRGARGGVWLARPPEEISLLDVLTAIDGNIVLNHCVEDPTGCERSTECPIHVFWAETCSALVQRLRTTTFASLAEPERLPLAS